MATKNSVYIHDVFILSKTLISNHSSKMKTWTTIFHYTRSPHAMPTRGKCVEFSNNLIRGRLLFLPPGTECGRTIIYQKPEMGVHYWVCVCVSGGWEHVVFSTHFRHPHPRGVPVWLSKWYHPDQVQPSERERHRSESINVAFLWWRVNQNREHERVRGEGETNWRLDWF